MDMKSSAKVLDFDEIQFIYFLVWIVFFGFIVKKALLNPRSQKFTPMFFPKCFLVLALLVL